MKHLQKFLLRRFYKIQNLNILLTEITGISWLQFILFFLRHTNKVLRFPVFDFHFIGLESSQLLQTDLTPERMCSNDNCFSLAIIAIISPIMFARGFFRNKHKRVKAFSGCIIFLLSITKSNLLTKSDILKSTREIFTYESIDACNLLHTCHIHNAFVFFALSKFKYRNKDSFFKLLLLLSGDISLNPGPSHTNQTSGNNE